MNSYNFYGKLNVTTNFYGHRGYKKYFDNEYKRIVSNSSETSAQKTINVHVVPRLPDQQDNDIIRETRFKKLFLFKYIVRSLDTDSVHIYFKRHWIDRLYMNAIGVFLQAQVLEPVMYLKLLESNVLFMHAGGVSRNGNGYLMAAHGGTGKTTFSIALLNNGFKLLGDDLLFVDIENRTVHPYARPMHIFTYNINNLKGATIPLKYKLIIYTKNVLRFVLERVLGVEFLISTRIHADEVFKGKVFSDSVKYKSIFFLRKEGPASESVALSPTNYMSIAHEIMNSADLNDSLYELVGDEEMIASIKRLELRVLVNMLEQFMSLTYINTRRLDLNNLTKFIETTF